MVDGDSKKRQHGVQTAAHLLECALEELENSGQQGFSLERVLQASETSRGSLYHHFGSKDGLLTAAIIEQIHRQVNSGIAELRRLVEVIDSGQVIVDLISLGITESGKASHRERRMTRAGTFAAGQHSEVVKAALRNAEERNNEDFRDLLVRAKQRNLLNPREPFSGTMAILSSLVMGRIVIDVLEDDAVDAAWIDAATEVVRGLLRPVI